MNCGSDKYHLLVENLPDAYAYHKVVKAEDGEPDDYIFLEVNCAFEEMTGYSREKLIGKKVTEIIPGIKNSKLDWIRTFGQVALSGNSTSFESFVEPLKRWYAVQAYGDKPGFFAAIFKDITAQKDLETTLTDSEENLSGILNNLEDGVWSMTYPGEKILYISPSLEKIYGRSLEELYRNPMCWQDAVHPDDKRLIENAYNQIKNEGKADRECRIIKPDGKMVWIRDRSKIIYDEDNQPVRIEGIVTDITERKEIEAQIEKLAEIVDIAPNSITVHDTEGNFLYANERTFSMHNYSKDEFLELNLEKLDTPESAKLIVSRMKEIEEKGEASFLVKHLRKDGSTFPLQVFAKKIDWFGRPALLSIASDITEREKAEDELRRVNYSIENLPDSIFWVDETGHFTDVNTAACRELGYSREEMLTMSVADVDPNFPSERWSSHWQEMKKYGLKVIETVHRTKGGKLIPMELVIHNQRFGNTQYNIVLGRDITERNQAEEKLEQEQKEKELILNNLAENVAFLDPEMRIIWANSKVIERHNLENVQYKGEKCYEVYHQLNEPCPDCPIIDVFKTGTASSGVHIAPDGCYWNVAGKPVFDEGGKMIGVLDTALDISDLIVAQQELQEREDRFQRMLKVIPDMISVHDTDMNIVYSNWTGFAAVPPEKQVLNTKCYKTYRDYDQVCPDCRAIQVFDSKETFQQEVELAKDYWIELRVIPIFDSSGEVEYFIEWVRDISSLKAIEEELRILNVNLDSKVKDRTAQLEAANRELDAFTYSASHDLRGPLNRINGFSEALLEDYADLLDSQGKDYLQRIVNSSCHMGELIDDLLKLSKVSQQQVSREPVELSALANVYLRELQAVEPAREIEMVIEHGLVAEADTALIRIALENLLSNAWKYTAGEETSRIEFGSTVEDGKEAYYISDNGAGFDMQHAEKLFTPFQRLHGSKKYTGTGIGLSIVSRIIHRHGGEIWAEGEPGKGACFYFTLS